MSDIKLRAAILIISDTAFRDPSSDKAGDILKETFASEVKKQWVTLETKIVADSVLDIQHSIQGWTDTGNPVNLIVTTGGTGFATKDYTPEVSQFSSLRRFSEDHSKDSYSAMFHSLRSVCLTFRTGCGAPDTSPCSGSCVSHPIYLRDYAYVHDLRHGMLAASLAVTPCTFSLDC